MYWALTSLFLYKELMMSFIMRFTSVWNWNLSAFSRNSFICATLSPSSLMASSSRLTTSSSENQVQAVQKKSIPIHIPNRTIDQTSTTTSEKMESENHPASSQESQENLAKFHAPELKKSPESQRFLLYFVVKEQAGRSNVKIGKPLTVGKYFWIWWMCVFTHLDHENQ